MTRPGSTDQEGPRVRGPCDSETCFELRSARVKIPDAVRRKIPRTASLGLPCRSSSPLLTDIFHLSSQLLNGQLSRIIQQTERRILTALPLELVLEIAGHLDDLDRTFLAFSCKSMARCFSSRHLHAPSLEKHRRFALRSVPCPQLEHLIAYTSPPDGTRLCCRCLAWMPTGKDHWLERWPGLDEQCADAFRSAPRVRGKACRDRVCGTDHRCPRCNSKPFVFVDKEEDGQDWGLIRRQMEAWDRLHDIE
jgi:hypothetical protein